MPNKDSFSVDFDSMDEDALGITQAVTTKTPVANGVKPKAVTKVSGDPMEQEDIGEAEIGFTPDKTGVSNFWTTKKSATPAQPEKLDKNLGYEDAEEHNFTRRKVSKGEESQREHIRASASRIFGEEEGKKTPNIPLDTPVSNGYWGAMFTFTCMSDVEVVVDAPVGCYSLPATATINYTDALPEIGNLASSNITEVEVTLDGTTRRVMDAVRRVKEREERARQKKHLIVVSSQESELIGSDHVMSLQRKHPDVIYFSSRAFELDEWKARDVSLLWLYQERKRRIAAGLVEKSPPADFASTPTHRVNIISSTYSCFNSYADLHELERLVRGAGGDLYYSFPFGAKFADMDRLDESAVNVVMYREFGDSLAKELGKPYLFAPFGMQETTEFVLQLGKLLGTEEQAKAFVAKEKRETLLPIWDIWLGAPQDFYNTTKLAIIANESYALGLKRFLGDELGMEIGTVINRQKSNDTNNYMLRNRLQAERPTVVMGSMNERIYMAEAGLTARFIPAALPVPFVNRSVGTPYMGYMGAVYVIQLVTNAIFDVLFDILPRERRDATGLPAGPGGMRPTANAAPPAQSEKHSAKLDELSELKWRDEAKTIFDQLLEKVPWVARISASDKLRQAAVSEARAANLEEVTVEMVMKALPQVMR
ncbi:nitrogenase component 1 [Candidatus Chlorohelix sp.]|uniref:nitrogenase component 1 n=1 Tax=Candidatus Chlorohelix sp. TaxID=3139201 RepID=UPI0030349206